MNKFSASDLLIIAQHNILFPLNWDAKKIRRDAKKYRLTRWGAKFYLWSLPRRSDLKRHFSLLSVFYTSMLSRHSRALVCFFLNFDNRLNYGGSYTGSRTKAALDVRTSFFLNIHFDANRQLQRHETILSWYRKPQHIGHKIHRNGRRTNYRTDERVGGESYLQKSPPKNLKIKDALCLKSLGAYSLATARVVQFE